MPVPAQIMMTGIFATSSGKWNEACEGRTATWMRSPAQSSDRYVDAVPWYWCAGSEREGEDRTA